MNSISEHMNNLPLNRDFKSPFWMISPHLETIIPSTLRKLPELELQRHRLELDDGDFLDLDWSKQGSKKLAILSHGLEGSSRRPYTLGMIKELGANGIDSLAWNCRSCSGVLNRLPRLYHHADFDDLDAVINYAKDFNYEEIFLVGFSMGGNLSLHWMAEYSEKAKETISKSIVFSSPLDLKASALHLMKPSNVLYKNRFLSKLKEKLKSKSEQFPEEYNLKPLNEIRSFYDLDEHYTAPIHGFKGADDFYQKGSTLHKLNSIKTETLLVQALNDPFFPASCYPSKADIGNSIVKPFYTRKGGHVGFTQVHNKSYFSENLAVKFLLS